MRNGDAFEIELSHPLYAASAMIVGRDDASNGGDFSVYVTRASRGLVSVAHPGGRSGAGKVRDLAVANVDTPLAATLVDGALFVTNSQPGKLPEFGGTGGVVSSFQILYFGPRYLASHQREPGPASTIVEFP